MAPVEFEKNIREKLRGERINPSGSAWDKLSGRLDEIRPHRRSRRPWTFAAAACLAVAAGIWVMRRSGSDLPPDTQELTMPDSRDTMNREPVRPQFLPEPEAGLAVESDPPPAPDRESTQASPPEQWQEKPERLAAARAGGEEYRATEQEASGLAFEIDRQLDTVLAEVALLETRDGGVSDAEIDSLLRRAQDRIASEREPRPGDTVDAMALLSDAEGELDRTFREQLFDKLKTGFMKVRTAVADRNN